MNTVLRTLDDFYTTPLGRYALNWEEQQYDKLVSDCFGYYALQLGGTSIDFLRSNRIGTKIYADEHLTPLTNITDRESPRVQVSFENLPFETESVDLIVMPHTLEAVDDPHALLREVYRVLIPNGRLIVTGFNMMSLWGIRFRMQRLGVKPFLPGNQFISVFQLRDWLHLLSFNVDRGAFGAYHTTLATEQSHRSTWIEKAGDRWWPQCGALYAIGARKMVPGGKLVGKAINKRYSFFGTHAGAQMERQAEKVLEE